MLTENDVVRYVCQYLLANGYAIQQQLNTTEHGIDIIACKNNIKLMVEAKGATSASIRTNRYGSVFNRNQVNHHVAMALYMISKLITHYGNDEIKYAIALPRNQNHIDSVRGIQTTIDKMEIMLIWVDETGDVVVEN